MPKKLIYITGDDTDAIAEFIVAFGILKNYQECQIFSAKNFLENESTVCFADPNYNGDTDRYLRSIAKFKKAIYIQIQLSNYANN